MNTGIIATRYATALLKLVDETGAGEVVAAQVQTIGKALDEVADFRRAVIDPAVASVKKIALFEAALSPVPAVRQSHQSVAGSSSPASGPVGATSLAPDLRKFIELLIHNGRIGEVRLVFTTFITEYYRSRHIRRARLVVADPALMAPESAGSQRTPLESRLRDLVEKQTGCELILKTEVNPSLIGGFVFEVEDAVLDASVSRQLDVIRRQFVEKNRRIV